LVEYQEHCQEGFHYWWIIENQRSLGNGTIQVQRWCGRYHWLSQVGIENGQGIVEDHWEVVGNGVWKY
jgi:hypothetical protein